MLTCPISAIIPTYNRAQVLRRTLESLVKQQILPAELIVIDGSSDSETRMMLESWKKQVVGHCCVRWQAAVQLGAAVQRNQGVRVATQPYILFFDDDVVFEMGCIERLWQAIEADSKLGGVNAIITNQSYQPPGWISQWLFTALASRRQHSFAGQVIGPGVNLLPEDRNDLPEVVTVEWLNLGCTIYRGEALPDPPFDSIFTGYSMMEDLTLSLRVGRQWHLANVRKARIYHDSQPGTHKSDLVELSQMELVNRHYIMTEILGRKRFVDYARLLLWEAFQLGVCAARPQSRPSFEAMWRGKWLGAKAILTAKVG